MSRISPHMAKGTDKLVERIAKLSARKAEFPDDTTISLFSAADELRSLAGADQKLLRCALDGFLAGLAKGDPNAAVMAGGMTLMGEGTKPDPDAALAIFLKGADGGNWDCALKAAKLHYHHTHDYAAAKRYASMALAPHNPDSGAAHYLLGLMAYNGRGQDKDPAKAFTHHKKAAAKGDADAMFELYVLYSTGDGIDKDDAEALKWCKKAADLGQHRACYNMGAFHATGSGVKKDLDKARMWYMRAAAAGNEKAAATLAAMDLIDAG